MTNPNPGRFRHHPLLRKKFTTRLLLPVLAVAIATACAPSKTDEPEPVAEVDYQSPLVQLQRLVGGNDHIHIDEVRYRAEDRKLFQCGYDFGVIDAADPASMTYLAERLRHSIPGDERRPGCIHLAADGDMVYTVHRGNIDNPAFLSGWDLRTDRNDASRIDPVQLPVLQEPGVSYEGVDTANGLVYVALRQNGLGIYEPTADGFRRIGTATGLANAWGVRVRDELAFVSDGLDGLAVIDIANPEAPLLIGRVATGGQARGIAVNGDIVYVAAGSSGLVIVDVSDPRAPRVIGRSEDVPGTAMRVDYMDGYAYLAAWTDARVYDVSDPTAPAFEGAVRMTRDIGFEEADRAPVTSRTLGIAAAEDAVLLGNWHVVYSYAFDPGREAPNIHLPEAINRLDFGSVAADRSRTIPVAVTNQGTAPLNITETRVANAAFTVEPERLRLDAGETKTIQIRYTAGDDQPAASVVEFVSDDPAEPVRTGFLTANEPGLGLGDPLPEMVVNLVDGGQWSSTEHAGEVMLLAYFATF
jgi:hypothetical protein